MFYDSNPIYERKSMTRQVATLLQSGSGSKQRGEDLEFGRLTALQINLELYEPACFSSDIEPIRWPRLFYGDRTDSNKEAITVGQKQGEGYTIFL